MSTPIPQIILARDGLVDWHTILNGGKPKEKQEKPPIQDRIKSAFRALGAKTSG